VKAALPALLLALTLGACGGGGDSSPTPPPSPNPNPTNPCSTTSEGESLEPAATAADSDGTPKFGIDGSTRWRVLEDLWRHRQSRARRVRPEPSVVPEPVTPPRDSADIGQIAVLQDEGDLIAAANSYDLRGLGLRFTPGGGGYEVRRVDGTFRSSLGTKLTLSDDDTSQQNVPFGFVFYGTAQTAAFVNSDGNITFGDGDSASTERNVARLLTGPPRVAPFLADLDPGVAGEVYVHAAPDQYTVTWCRVRGFESSQTTTVQATLLPDGTIELKYGASITLSDAVAGISPGRTAEFTAVDLSSADPASGAGAIGERFAANPQLDTVATTQKFYRSHPDAYDQLVIWTDARLVQDSFAYESTVANEIRGIGNDVFDLSRDFGSGGRLRSLAIMDALTKYPDDPNQRFLGENTTLSLVAHESGHRWLALFRFRDHRGETSDLLLGRQLAHWSFFFDSDASVMEGNDIEDLGGGSFRTAAAAERYSRLDQYAMGLLPESEVPSFFYVESPTNIIPVKERESAPDIEVTFNGTRREVLIQDIVAVEGRRQPAAADSPRVHRQAFVYVVSRDRTPESTQIAKLDRIRREWEGYFQKATDGRMRATTALR
jgi:hypothetical protein